MKDLLIYGAGGFGREVALMIEHINDDKLRWKVLGFVDDGLPPGSSVDGLEVVGAADAVSHRFPKADVIVAIAEPAVRKKLVEQLRHPMSQMPTIVHPSAQLGSRARNSIGSGCIITGNCTLTTGISIGNFVILNLHATVGHDVVISPYCTLMPGCNVSGNVRLGEATLVGTGAQVLQNLSIGMHCKIGAGAVVTKSFGDRLTLLGVPAQPQKGHAEGV